MSNIQEYDMPSLFDDVGEKDDSYSNTNVKRKQNNKGKKIKTISCFTGLE